MCTKPEEYYQRQEPNTNKLHITNMERIKRKITHRPEEKKDFFLHELCIFSTTTMYYYNFYYYYHITLFGLQTICIPYHSVRVGLRF